MMFRGALLVGGVAVVVLSLAGCPSDSCEIDPDTGLVCVDEDGDGYCADCCEIDGTPAYDCALVDCDDGDAFTHPRAADHFNDGKDFDCNGDDLGGLDAPCDSDDHCSVACNITLGTCIDTPEQCDSGVDEDLDGLRDCEDDDCRDVCGGLLSAACEAASAPDDIEQIVFDEASNVVRLSCGDDDTRDAVYRLDAPNQPGQWELVATHNTAWVSLRHECTGAELACSYLDAHPLVMPVEGDLPLYLWLSETMAVADSTMSFIVSFSPAFCADGEISPPESCDDGNSTSGDGCDDRCRVEPGFDVCGGAIVTELGVTLGTTRFGTSLLSGSCAGMDAPERVHVYTPASTGTLSVALSSDAPLALTVRGQCELEESEQVCAPVVPSETLLKHIPVTAGEPLTIVVDGAEPRVSGDYQLTLVLST